MYNYMKKIILSIVSLFILTSVFAQGAMTVNPVDFTSNPARFNGKLVAISNLVVNLESTTSPSPVSPVGGGAPIPGLSATPGAPGPMGGGAAIIRCNAPRGFRVLDVDFTNDPNFNACFFISEAMYKSLPKGQPSVRATLTFKGDARIGYTITMYKLQ